MLCGSEIRYDLLRFSGKDARFPPYPVNVFYSQYIGIYSIFPGHGTPLAPTGNSHHAPMTVGSFYL